MSTRLRTWSVDEFRESRALWDDLVRRSDADPLFMSWDWQWRWWNHHSQVLGAALRLAAVYEGDRLVGLAPFYSRVARVRGVLRSRRLELMGIAWRDPRAMFSDYPDIIAASGERTSVLREVEGWLAAEPFWDEIALCCTKRSGVAAQLAVEKLSRWTLVRDVDGMTGWRARLPSSFESYVGALTPTVRRKLFNQRRKLAEPRMDYVSGPELSQALEQLWRFSAARWHRGPPGAEVRAFQEDIARFLASTGELRFSRLCTADGLLSTLYCIQRAGTVYYLQSGFDAGRGRGLSPGLLHFGYAIEAACKEGGNWFDFLAGTGRNRDYKRDLLTESVPVVSYHIVRRRVRRALYKAYEYAQRRRNSLHPN